MKYFFLTHIGIPIGSLLFRLWRASIRIHLRNIENLEEAYRSGRGIIFGFWHGDLFAIACGGMEQIPRRKIYILTSKSRDGELLTRFLHKIGYGAVRGSSYRGGFGGFLSLNSKLRKGNNTAIALDGSRGPRYDLKAGAIFLAKTSGALLLPIAVKYHTRITLNSWDHCEIPLPFSKCTISIGQPVAVSRDINRDALEEIRSSLETTLKGMKGISTHESSLNEKRSP